ARRPDQAPEAMPGLTAALSTSSAIPQTPQNPYNSSAYPATDLQEMQPTSDIQITITGFFRQTSLSFLD
ncbi:MAG TPA: hypothetical protein PKA48_05755, partial [Candidatus Obscuribacter sp.]|nr:hypothetical protein [Candidatus Obscuribacter sp.]